MSRTSRDDPFFLVGDSRSGTTYLANLLIHHPEIAIAPESKFVLRLLDRFEDTTFENQDALSGAFDEIWVEQKFQDWRLVRTDLAAALESRLPLTFADLVRSILTYYCEREFPGRPVWGLKKGGRYILDAERILAHFPKAKFVHIVRDGRAVFASKRKAIHSKWGTPFETSPVRAAEIWTGFVEAFDAFRERNPDSALEVSFEKMLEDLDGISSAIFGFLGVDPDPSIAERAREALEPSYVVDRSRYLHENVSAPPQLARIDAWRGELSEHEVRAFETIAFRALEAKGYARVTDGDDGVARLALRMRQSARSVRRWISG